MRIRTALLACALILPATASFAAEKYMCTLTADTGKQDAAQTVALTIDGNVVRPVIHIGDATKDLTFANCKAVAADGSSFARWFETECREMHSADGTPYTVEAYLADAYAGISPTIGKSYAMYETLAALSKKAGIKMPDRTFVIYADRKPVHEFFCTAEKP